MSKQCITVLIGLPPELIIMCLRLIANLPSLNADLQIVR